MVENTRPLIPTALKTLIAKGVKKYPLFEQWCGQERWSEFWGF
ncbi:hypothetical protein PG630_02215 [Riemerella anatipestifer]|nr:hypothetical protein [Riemerella anatipestifer]